MGPGSWIQSAAALAFVLVLVVAAGWLARRFGAVRPASASALKAVATLSVGARERVVVVEAGESWLVLGVAPGRVNALHVMPRQELPAPAAPPAFAELLAKLRP